MRRPGVGFDTLLPVCNPLSVQQQQQQQQRCARAFACVPVRGGGCGCAQGPGALSAQPELRVESTEPREQSRAEPTPPPLHPPTSILKCNIHMNDFRTLRDTPEVRLVQWLSQPHLLQRSSVSKLYFALVFSSITPYLQLPGGPGGDPPQPHLLQRRWAYLLGLSTDPHASRSGIRTSLLTGTALQPSPEGRGETPPQPHLLQRRWAYLLGLSTDPHASRSGIRTSLLTGTALQP
ncbi:hypothetical protein INR49_001297 [Caranx melampygus]|nr:hypothetical protein INR49_001297 [Caranx melampygus]